MKHATDEKDLAAVLAGTRERHIIPFPVLIPLEALPIYDPAIHERKARLVREPCQGGQPRLAPADPLGGSGMWCVLKEIDRWMELK